MKKIFLLFLVLVLSISASSGQETAISIPPRTDTNQVLTNISQAAALEHITPDSAISLLTVTLEESRQQHFYHGICSSLTHLGMANMAKGEADTALFYYTSAFPYLQQCSYDKELTASLYTGTGFSWLRKANYALGSSYFYRSLQIITDNHMQESATAGHLYLDLGVLWWHLRRYDYTKSYFRRSELIAERQQDTAAMIAVYANLGNLYFSMNDIKTSDVYMQRALRLAEKKHAVRAQQQLLANMGASLRGEGNAAAAIPYFEKAISLADDTHAHQHNLQSYYNLGFAYYETGNYDKARQYILSAIRTSEKLDMDKEHMGEAMQVLAGVYEKEKNYKEANVWLNNSLSFIQNTLQKEADSSINKLEDNYRISEKNKQLAQKQLLLSKKELEIKNKNVWIGSITAGLLLLGMALLMVMRFNRHRQRLQKMQIRNLEQEKELVYLKAMMEGEEKERARLARELHDGIGGMLVSAKMGLGAVKETNTDAVTAASLNDVMRLLNDTAAEVRQTAHNLMPDMLIKNSLKDALLLYCADINTGGQLEIDLQFHGRLEEMSKSVELIFYRITQELVQNIIKHAQATQAVIQIIQDQGRLNLIVEDNGVGFDQAEINSGFGLQNLQFRVQALQGYISVTSAKGKGTSVYIEFDLEKLKNV
ncbi:tetratricopeptide repeat-containing sensor histidine kinase [Chitinophagaceae bacterium MMS25-I14]